MSAKPPVRPATHGSLRWVRDVLGRSLGLEQRRKAAEASVRRPAGTEPLSMLLKQRAELGARLLVHDPATQPVKNLFIVHDQLGGPGWPGVEALPIPVVARAVTEARILQSDEPSTLLATIIESLQALVAASEAKSAEEALLALEREWEVPQCPEVSETNYDEYELMERSWVGTVPAGLGRASTSPGRL